MKRILLSLLLAGITATAFAQGCPITVTVPVSEPGTGLTTIDYDFTGVAGRTYTFTSVEVDFGDGDGYQPIPEAHLSGDYPCVGSTTTTFSGTIVWDGLAGFPDRYHEQTRVRITAQHFLSGDGVTDIDGNHYPTVIIGDQEWMAKNLRVTKYRNGDAIPTGLNNVEWSSTTSGAYAIYPHDDFSGFDSDAEMVAVYGKLYNWYAVYDSRGLCPEGWKVPSDAEWSVLVDYVVDQGFPDEDVVGGAGNALKSCLKDGTPALDCCDTDEHPRFNSHGTHYGFDAFGFSALPGGYRWESGNFMDIDLFGVGGLWWSATEFSDTRVWYRVVRNRSGYVFRNNHTKRFGFSVRCVKDIE